jgi:hypothetical protein
MMTKPCFDTNQWWYTREYVKEVIEVIGTATKAGAWKEQKLQELEAAKMTIPDYIMEFWYISNTEVSMLNGDNPKMYETADDQNIRAKVDAYLEKSTTPTAKYGQDKLECWIANLKLDKDVDVDTIPDFEQYIYQSIINYNWATLGLFAHIGIRNVGFGEEEDNKYCLWFAVQPEMNNRKIEPNILFNPTDRNTLTFIKDLMDNPGVMWNTQALGAFPYHVCEEREDDIDHSKGTPCISMITQTDEEKVKEKETEPDLSEEEDEDDNIGVHEIKRNDFNGKPYAMPPVLQDAIDAFNAISVSNEHTQIQRC